MILDHLLTNSFQMEPIRNQILPDSLSHHTQYDLASYHNFPFFVQVTMLDFKRTWANK